MRRVLYIAWLCLAACTDKRGTEPTPPQLEETAEYWSNGYLRSVYQHYTNARGQTVLHGSFRTYSERVQNLLWKRTHIFQRPAHRDAI